MPSIFESNLAALRIRSPETAALVDVAVDHQGHRIVTSTTGLPVLEFEGRALDSRRDPVGTARALAETCPGGRVALAGLGTGYLAEALVDRGHRVTGIVVDHPASLREAMRARDLGRVLTSVPVWCLESLCDPVALALLRVRADALVGHPPSVVASPELRALRSSWDSIPVAGRPPRVVVVGPITGGSLAIAASTASAVGTCGADVRFVDPATCADAYRALGGFARSPAAGAVRQGQLADLIGDAIGDAVIEERADLVVALAQAPMHRAVLERLKNAGVTTAFWFVENERVLTYWQDIASAYDWFYGIQPGAFVERLHDAGAPRPGYLPLACDPELHVPVMVADEEAQRFGGDVTFAGSPYLNRRHVFSGLADLGLRLWGPGWGDPGLAGCVAEGGRRFSTDEMIRIFSASRINLNLHSAAHVKGLDPDPDYVNPRTFELASCGAFQLVDRRDPLPELFTDDELVTFSSLAELRMLIERYLDDPDARRAVANNARVRVHRDHTYVQRLTRVLRDTLAPEFVAAAMAGVTDDRLDDILARHESEPTLSREEALLRVVREAQWSSVAS